MSDTEKSVPPPAPAEASRPPRPPRERPERREGKPQDLRQEDQAFAASAPRLRDLDAAIEHELAAALGDFDAQATLGTEQKKGRALTDEGGRKKARVLAVRGSDVFVDVPGGRSQGVLSVAQFPEGVPAVGTEVDISIEGYDAANGLLIVTRRGAVVEADWSSIAEGMIVEARVTETNKGGLAVDVNGIRGFLPISQIDLYRVEQPEQFINQRLRCLVTEVNREERNLVVSRRALLEKEREEQREKLWAELAEGQVREGVVRSVRDFGAFVDLGGVDGLVHVSEMSWNRVQDPATLLRPGQSVKVVVLKVDRERRKVSLGMRQLIESPWDHVDRDFPEGSIVKGKVSRTTDYGAFVEMAPAVEGLIHVSELAPFRVRRVTDVVQVGQEVAVMVLSLNKEQRRISLSLRAAKAQEIEDEPAEDETGEDEVKPPRPRTTPLRGGIGDQVRD